MNREEHLRRSLPEWLKLPGLAEVVVVDWSNARPLIDLTRLDTRVRVVRAEGEPKWVLSYAYNLGVSRAASPLILKCDADCQPRSPVTALRPGDGHFYAGYWKSGAPVGKPSVNGQCLFSRAQFDAVNGYSEFIRTYGRDDEDFYDRLIAAGYERREIAPSELEFLEHRHEARMANQVSPGEAGIEGWLRREVVYNEMRNAYLARALPWGPARPRAAFATVETGERWEVVRRDADAELAIPALVAASARLASLRYLVQKVARLPAPAAARLDERACLALLANRLAAAAAAA